MIRPLLWLAGLVLVLALGNAWLAGREARARAGERRVGALFTREEAERLRKQPALRVEASGEAHAYGRVAGRWRCLSYHQAPADGRAIQALLDGVVQAEGLVHADTSAEAAAFGIATPHTLRVSIQGPRAGQDPAGDVLATLEIGLAQPDREGCFVRKKGTREIWSIAGDLRAPLEARLAPGLPPLLEPAAVPSDWLEQGGAVRITLAHGAQRTVLERQERTLDPAEMKPGDRPWKWVLGATGGEPESAAVEVSEAFVDFLEHLPYAAVLDPARRTELGLAPPRATVTLAAHEGPSLALAFGASDAQGRVALWVAASETLYLVEARTFELAVPEPSRLAAPPGEDDPWSAALRAARD